MTTDDSQFIGKYSRIELQEMYKVSFTDEEWRILKDSVDLDNLEYSTLITEIYDHISRLDEIVSFYKMYEPLLDEENKKKGL